MFLIYLAKRRKTLYAIIVIYVFTWNFLSCSLNIEETSCFVKWFISKEFASWGYAWTYLTMSNLILGFPWPLPVRSVFSRPKGMVDSYFRYAWKKDYPRIEQAIFGALYSNPPFCFILHQLNKRKTMSVAGASMSQVLQWNFINCDLNI